MRMMRPGLRFEWKDSFPKCCTCINDHAPRRDFHNRSDKLRMKRCDNHKRQTTAGSARHTVAREPFPFIRANTYLQRNFRPVSMIVSQPYYYTKIFWIPSKKGNSVHDRSESP